MTTIVGVKTPNGIVIGGDSCLQHFDLKGKETESSFGTKIHVGDYHALASSGWHDGYYEAFEEYLAEKVGLAYYLATIADNCNSRSFDSLVGDVRPKISKGIEKILSEAGEVKTLFRALQGYTSGVSKKSKELAKLLDDYLEENSIHPIDYALKDQIFRELALLNRLRRERYRPHIDEKPDDSELLIAINDPKLELYLVEGSGVMRTPLVTEDIRYLTSGSGSEDVENYIDHEKWKKDPLVKGEIGLVRPHRLRLNQTIWMVLGAITYASTRDVYTGGDVHIAVVEEGKITNHTLAIETELSEVKRRVYRKVAKAHTKRR